MTRTLLRIPPQTKPTATWISEISVWLKLMAWRVKPRSAHTGLMNWLKQLYTMPMTEAMIRHPANTITQP